MKMATSFLLMFLQLRRWQVDYLRYQICSAHVHVTDVKVDYGVRSMRTCGSIVVCYGFFCLYHVATWIYPDLQSTRKG